MSPKRSDLALLWDMLDAAKAVKEFVASRSFQDYMSNRMLRGAVERHVEIIGEAANKVSRAFRDTHPEIPWERIIARRHLLVHEYFDLEDEAVWEVATLHVPELIPLLEKLLPAPPAESKE